jgi:type IV pilus assembly protein PilB
LIRDSQNSAGRMVETIIFTALERGGTDIHIQPRATEVTVKYCVGGVWQHATEPIAKESHRAMLSRLKVLSDVDINDRGPHQGRFRVKYKGRYFDFGVSIAPARHGQDALLYVLDKGAIDLRDKTQ